MNFFEHQDRANKKTGRLIFFFFVGLFLTLVAVNAVVYGAIYFISLDSPILLELLEEPLWIHISAFFILIMALGTLIKMVQISSGGLSIARMVGARSLNDGLHSFEEKRFINIVEEMAIASGTPVPQLFVMDDEAINAFVAGTKMDDTVMVVTTGALTALNREELQAVVGHEFSHILNGDMKISLKLIGVLGGILMIGKVGQVLIRMRPARSSSSRGNGVLVIIMIGFGLLIVGSIGLFFGRLMKAAVSRQRELLADASSVQFTRNPRGLASAFRVMQMHEAGTHLQTNNAEDVSHMCFGPSQWFMFSGLLGTHPPLEERIKAIDPHDQYGILPRQSQPTTEPTPAKQTGLNDLLPLAAGAVLQVTPEAIASSIASPSDDHIAYAIAIAAAIPEPLREVARQKEQVEALIVAMLCLNHEEDGSTDAIWKAKLSLEQYKQVVAITEHLRTTEVASLLPLFELSVGTFNRLTEQEKQAIYNKGLELLEQIDARPVHFALLTILHNQIKANQVKKPTINKLDKVLKEITYILTILLSCSSQSYEQQKACFKQEMGKLTSRNIAYPKLENFRYETMIKMLSTLNQVTPLGKEQIIKACIRCVMHDGKIVVAEGELLRAICEALNCPIPPIIAST